MRELVRERDVVKLLTEMIAIPGKSCEERLIAEWIVDTLEKAGLPDAAVRFDDADRKSPYGGNCGNLIVQLKGTIKAPRRLLMAHIDTVPLCVGARPQRDGDVIRPRDKHTALGGDDRAGAAVVLNALLTILKHNLPHPPLTFFWPVQEEIGLIGARYVNFKNLGDPKLCFNWDGGAASDITIGATGADNLKIVVHGLASHAGIHPEKGINAIAVASIAITELVQNGWHGLVVKGKNRGTCNLGIMHAGDATNVVTDRCEIKGEVRSHDAKFRNKILTEIEKAFRKAVKTLKNDEGKVGSLDFETDLKYEAFLISEREPVVQEATRVVTAMGLTPRHGVANGGLDANWLSARGLPTVTLGCGEKNVHTVNEVVEIEHFVNACKIGIELALGERG